MRKRPENLRSQGNAKFIDDGSEQRLGAFLLPSVYVRGTYVWQTVMGTG